MIGLGSDKKSKWFCSSFSPSQHNNPCVIFRCFYLPVFSSFLLYQELQGHLPFFTRFLPDDIKTRWLPILSKKLSLLKSFIFHQQAVLGWPNLLAEQVSLIKSYVFDAYASYLCYYWSDDLPIRCVASFQNIIWECYKKMLWYYESKIHKLRDAWFLCLNL